jgi:hypothetical protein
MYVKAKQLRERGRRRHNQDISADQGKLGELTLASVAGVYQLNLNAPDSSVHAPLYPVLHEARLTTMHGDKMLFQGIERAGDGAEYVQEWSAQVLSRG